MAAQTGAFLPNEVLSDISDFISDYDVENLSFLSRAFAAVVAKRWPIINAESKMFYKTHLNHRVWEYRKIEDYFKENQELTTERREQITARNQIDKELIEYSWAIFQEWSKKGVMNEDPILKELQEHPLYKEDPEGFMPEGIYDSSELLPWEIIYVLYKENAELTMERRDQISADFHIEKILIEAHWNAFQRIYDSQQGKPKESEFWEWVEYQQELQEIMEQYDPTMATPVSTAKSKAYWYQGQRHKQQIIEDQFKENQELTVERRDEIYTELDKCPYAHFIDKQLVVQYWILLHRRNKQNDRADEMLKLFADDSSQETAPEE
ncbi:hypothetical protein Ddc_11021 [Ditylenchus destructor]|nr:hypothetical protein Ddc_11021 [Ditylenchus destructor]